jgi:hypothetical protein
MRRSPSPLDRLDAEGRATVARLVSAFGGMVVRLERRRDAPPIAAPRARSACACCGGADGWVSRVSGTRLCRRCHPPVPGAEVAEVLTADSAAGAREGV